MIEFIDFVENYERQHFNNNDLHQFFDVSFRRSKKITIIQQFENRIKSIKHRCRFEKKIVITSFFIVITLIIFVATKSIIIVTKSNRQFRSRKSHISRMSISTSSSLSNNHYYQIDNYVNSKMNVKNRN